MKSLTTFFTQMNSIKAILLGITPIITMIVSIKAALIGLLILIILDLLTGIKKNLHKNNIPFNPFKKIFWMSIKSYLLRQTWRKSYEYGIGIIVIIVFESMIFGSTSIVLMEKAFTLSELAVLLASAVEVWSIFENVEKVSGGNILKKMSGFLPEPFKKLFSKDNEKLG